MKTPQVLISAQDASVNFVFTDEFGGILEARYVRRVPEYFIMSLSSQTGCKQACRMCELTITGQSRNVRDADTRMLYDQVQAVANWYSDHERSSAKAKGVHVSFMARGEPLASEYLLENGDNILQWIHYHMTLLDLTPVHLISTTMPQEMADRELIDIFPNSQPFMYYSIYTTNAAFRRRWLPRAIPVEQALAKLRKYQEATGLVVTLHWSFIEGENDHESDIHGICAAVQNAGLEVNINIIRYSPYSEVYGVEPSERVIERNVALLQRFLPEALVKVIPRAGQDVKASCGTFVSGQTRDKK